LEAELKQFCESEFLELKPDAPSQENTEKLVEALQDSFHNHRGPLPVVDSLPYSQLLIAVHSTLVSVVKSFGDTAPKPAAFAATPSWASAVARGAAPSASAAPALNQGTASRSARGKGASTSYGRSKSTGPRKGRLYQGKK
jgi:hypothetical protein